jgi:uncharacterized protein (TIGR03435 family)
MIRASMRSKAFGLLAVTFATGLVAAQTPAFEVASIKPQPNIVTGVRSSEAGTRFYRPTTTVRQLILFAYDLAVFRLVGGPEWIDSARWTVDARTSAPATRDEMRLMVRDLLRDRFQLAAHVETREQSAYELHLARPDGRLGPQLRPAAECPPPGTREPPTRSARPPGPPPCGGGLFIGAGYLSTGMRDVPISALVTHLENALRRAVTDKTGLTGLWAFELMYASETAIPLPRGLAALARLPNPPALDGAIQEQLGLKLESSRGPVDTLVIDSVSMPTPD